MKKIIFLIVILFISSAGFSYANTQTPAALVTTTTGTYRNCLGSLDTNVQTALNDIDNCFGSVQQPLTFPDSVVNNSNIVTLVNDALNPGNTMYYGTNGSGTKGFFSVPNTPPGGVSGNIQANNGASGFAGILNTSYDSNGNVGIGTSKPLFPFEVNGDSYFYAPDYTEFKNSSTFMLGSGGTMTSYVSGGVTYEVHEFDSSGTFVAPTPATNLHVFIVAPSGSTISASCNTGGGSGAGGVIDNFSYSATAAQNFTVTLGSVPSAGSQTNGTDTLFGTLDAVAGGSAVAEGNGNNGGSGAGGGGCSAHNGGTPTAGQGNRGGNGRAVGGGGYGAAGTDGANGTTGGIGYCTSITGVSRCFAGGGDGANGSGIGTNPPGNNMYGAGQSNAFGNCTAGVANTGSGSGGSNCAGASGIAIVAYVVPSGLPGIYAASPVVIGTRSGNSQLTIQGTGNSSSTNTVTAQGSTGTTTLNLKDNGQLFLLGNVGVGSLSPGQILDVSGTVRTEGFTLSTNPSSGYVLTSNAVGVGTWSPVGISSQWVGTNPIYFNGNVGIGSDTSPDQTLEITHVTGSDVFGVSSTSTSNGDYMIVKDGGNVGIGSVNPIEPLDVGGIIRTVGFTIGTSGVLTGSNGTGSNIVTDNAPNITGVTTLSTASVSNVLKGGATNASILTQEGTSAAAPTVASGITWDYGVNGNFSDLRQQGITGNIGIGPYVNGNVMGNILNVAGGVGIGTGSSSQFINTSAPNGGLILESNIGIGTWVPNFALQIGSTAFSVSAGGTVTVGSHIVVPVISTSSSGGSLSVLGGVNGGSQGGEIDYIGGVASTNPGILQFRTGTGSGQQPEVARIDVNGNLGIGTTIPKQALDVGTGLINAGGANLSNSGPSYFSGNLGIGTSLPNTIDNPQLQINNYSSSINTLSMQVSTNGKDNIDFTQSASTNPTVTSRLSVNRNNLYGNGTADIQFWTTPFGSPITNDLTISAPGNVGIGTAIPGALLDVEGTINPTVFYGNGTTGNVGIDTLTPAFPLSINSDGIAITLGTNSNNNVGIGMENNSGIPRASVQYFTTPFGSDTGFLRLLGGAQKGVGINVNTNSIPSLYINSSGNVGIGTTLPTGFEIEGMNVGIGTPAVSGQTLFVNGNLGIGTVNGTQGLIIGTSAPIVLTTGTGSMALNANPIFTSGTVTGTWVTPFLRSGSGTGSILELYGTSSPSPTSASGIRWMYGPSPSLEDLHQNGLSGNIGIGSFTPAVSTMNNRFMVVGDVGIGTSESSAYITTSAPNGGMIVQGNVGIGSTAPQASLDLGTTGTIADHRITGIGWSEHNATNQACNTTCGTSACVIGLDIGTVGVVNSGFVACTDATADDCLCAGP